MNTENKSFDQLTPAESAELKIEFAPGCLDSFEGTQEELDELLTEIKRMFASGEAQQQARQINWDDVDPEDAAALEHMMQERKLQ